MRKQRNNKSLIVLHQKEFKTKIKEFLLKKIEKICAMKIKSNSIDVYMWNICILKVTKDTQR